MYRVDPPSRRDLDGAVLVSSSKEEGGLPDCCLAAKRSRDQESIARIERCSHLKHQIQCESRMRDVSNWEGT